MFSVFVEIEMCLRLEVKLQSKGLKFSSVELFRKLCEVKTNLVDVYLFMKKYD